ncbi:unnamed protein product [Soboliphyme baturini]|uniref:Uncharacterized protein n=1 Tax=Soboliphyme baturini TaxID=241478 RepID=A0A183IE07_9BILA|nr:unnamed protein product [Soboliphyme baturini]
MVDAMSALQSTGCGRSAIDLIVARVISSSVVGQPVGYTAWHVCVLYTFHSPVAVYPSVSEGEVRKQTA